MEQFEKWFQRYIDEYPEEHKYCEMTWRAALEWVLNGLDYSTEHEEIKDRIHDELESD